MSPSKILIRAFFILGILLTSLFVILWITFDKQINEEFRKSVPYKVSVNYIKKDNEILDRLGENLMFGKSIGGHLTPGKNARLVFKVKGDKSSVRAICILTYQKNKWQVDSITYE